MRTTVTLDPDAEALIRKRMRERGQTFKQAVNEAIITGLTRVGERPGFRTQTHDLGIPRVNLTGALRLAGELEDEHILEVLAGAERDGGA